MPSEKNIRDRMGQAGIKEGDLIEKFIAGSGPGGQKMNKTASTVYLKHLPSGLEVKCQETRFQTQNRLLARLRLCERLEKLRQDQARQAEALRQKKLRSNRKRPKPVKAKILADKRRRSEVKKWRRKPDVRDD